MSNSYLSDVLKSLKDEAVLLPRLAAFLDQEALKQAKKSSYRYDIALQDARLTRKAMAQRIAEFDHGIESKAFEFHPSGIGSCLRRSWFSYFKAPRDRKHRDNAMVSYMVFELGAYIHVIIQNLCERAGVLEAREVKVYSKPLQIRGTADGIINIDGDRYVLELKSINSGQWTKVQQAPKYEHVWQMHCYMKVLGIKQAVLVYFNKDRSAFKEFVVPFEEARWLQARKRIKTLFNAVTVGDIPDREGEMPSRFPCSFCEYTSICFGSDQSKAFEAKVKRSLRK